MEWFHKIAEDRIKQAQDEGQFDNLPGKGKPFQFEDDSLIPEDLRLTYKILRNARCVPIELELRREIFTLKEQLAVARSEDEAIRLRRSINLAVLKLDIRRNRFDLT